MSEALYTKYRPQKFNEVLGQEHITDILSESLKLDKLSHAYLFVGSRGTGKTSVARILAKELKVSNNDIYEIDAASNTGVDNIREIIDSANTNPFDSEYKVYILDEVHMLSKSAFNALLKTLEEPPAHTIFILATTEVHKVPDTVISRCEVYNFKTPNREVLKKMVKKTAKAENINLSSSALDLITILGDGSFRNTHTILQKILRTEAVVNDKEVSVEEVEKVTGAPSFKLVNDVLSSLVEKDLEKGLKAINVVREENLDAKVFLKLVLEKFRAMLIVKVAENMKELYVDSVSEDDVIYIKELLGKDEGNINSVNLSKLIDVTNQSSLSHLPLLPLEIYLVEIIQEKG